MKKIFLITLILNIALLLGCKKETTITESNQPLDNSSRDALILIQYHNWASASKSHDYTTMKSVVVPGSSFDGATEVCKKAWDYGDELYYEFSNLEVVEYYETSAAVHGNWKIIFTDPQYNATGSFASFCVKKNGKWLLSGLNLNPN